MSRIGKAPIKLPDKVTVNVNDGVVAVKGPKGNLELALPQLVQIAIKDGEVQVTRTSDSKAGRSRHGLVRNLVNNMIVGVSEGYARKLEINGVGYRAEVKGKDLVLSLGFSHPVNFSIPEGVTIKVNKQTELLLEGIDKQLLGETAARIRKVRPPEPYKGKGVKYAEEVIQRKAGKTAV